MVSRSARKRNLARGRLVSSEGNIIVSILVSLSRSYVWVHVTCLEVRSDRWWWQRGHVVGSNTLVCFSGLPERPPDLFAIPKFLTQTNIFLSQFLRFMARLPTGILQLKNNRFQACNFYKTVGQYIVEILSWGKNVTCLFKGSNIVGSPGSESSLCVSILFFPEGDVGETR